MLRRILSTSLVTTSLALAACYAGSHGDASSNDAAAAAPRSLAGTAPDGQLRIGPDGGFVFDEPARAAFDYFLTADAELAPADHAAWVRDQLARQLPADAVDDAFAAWESYLAFRGEAAAALTTATDDLAAVERRLQTAVDEHLGDYPIAPAERAQISHAFALKRIDGLAPDAHERALAELSAEPSLADTEAGAFLTGRQAIALARLAGADAPSIAALRRDHFGAAAADRLAALDVQRAEWSRRLAAFHAERDALPPESLPAALEALEAEHFTPGELRRVHALDRLAAPTR